MPMRNVTLLLALILTTALIATAAVEHRSDPLPELVNVRDLAPDMTTAAVPADTTWVLGGPGTLSGKFQDAQGLPDWQGWTSIDLTQPTESHWSVSTYNAANLDTITGNHAWWCGDLFEPCHADDPPEGVGNDWYELLTWSGAVADPQSDCTVRVRAVLNQDLEPAYDFLYLQLVTTADYPVTLWDWTGQRTAYQLDVSHTLTPGDYLPGGEVRLRWRLITDGAYSDEDCLWPSGGGCEIDNITVTFDQGAGEVLIGEVETCEPGTVRQWTPTLVQGTGDYARIWPQLDDLDPAVDNPTPQVAFIDDGEVEPDSDGSPCITWCYGPGGFIVPPGRGLSELYNGIRNEIRSPVLALPPGEIGGAILAFDLYVHQPIDLGAPYIAPTWRVRSTADPAGIDGWSEWRWYEVFLWGDPAWLRPRHNVTDLLEPGATHVQIALGARNYICCYYDDGTPAPYFDNVAFMVHDDTGPAVLHVQADGAGEYATIQEAIYAAADGDTVRLADGIYTGPGNRDLSHLGKAIVIASASGDATACIIDCQGSDEDRHRGFDLSRAYGYGAVIAGITIRGGAEHRGGAIYLWRGGLTVERCIFADNLAVGNSRYGGALYADDSVVVVRDCVFTGNRADRGGAIAASDTDLELSGCVVAGNRADAYGSGLFAYLDGEVTITSCTFVGNRDQLNQGAISIHGHAHAQIDRTIVAFTELGSAVACGEYGTATLTCSNLYSNWNGDWSGCIADQQGTDGNFSDDPFFCRDALADDPYALQAISPCAPEHQPVCGLVGARPVGCTVITGAPAEPTVPRATRLLPAAPNPFNPRTTIAFELAAAGPVELAVFDLRGRRLRTLQSGDLAAGRHERTWEGRLAGGRGAPSGTYVLRLLADGSVFNRRVALLK